MGTRAIAVLLTAYCSLLTLSCSLLFAQQGAVESERAEYARWLDSAPTSPLAAVALVAIGTGLRLGPPGSDVPLPDLPEHRVSERNGRVTLAGPDVVRPLVRGRPATVGRHTVLAAGPPGRTTVTVYSAPPPIGAKRPAWYPYDPAADLSVALEPPGRPGIVRVLAADGAEVEAAEAGTVTVTIAGQRATLTVRRLPGASAEESELEVYFRDRTNGKGTYPAGRFVALVPAGEGRYRLDFNRGRNPFCAYSSIYPCPAPWRGNSVPAPVEAGERYSGGGLDPAAGSKQRKAVRGEG
jgi:hypothetical protein